MKCNKKKNSKIGKLSLESPLIVKSQEIGKLSLESPNSLFNAGRIIHVPRIQ